VSIPNEEKETTCVYDFVEDSWTVYSCVPRHITKLRKVAGEPFWTDKDGERITAAKWKLKGNQVRFALGAARNITEEQRQAASIRMKQLHQK